MSAAQRITVGHYAASYAFEKSPVGDEGVEGHVKNAVDVPAGRKFYAQRIIDRRKMTSAAGDAETVVGLMPAA